MKRLLFLVLILFACQKEKEEIKEKCWTCTTIKNGTEISKVWNTCDILEVTEWNNKRIVQTSWDYSGTYPVSSTNVYLTTCKER
jgi:hypothetical protein